MLKESERLLIGDALSEAETRASCSSRSTSGSSAVARAEFTQTKVCQCFKMCCCASVVILVLFVSYCAILAGPMGYDNMDLVVRIEGKEIDNDPAIMGRPLVVTPHGPVLHDGFSLTNYPDFYDNLWQMFNQLFRDSGGRRKIRISMGLRLATAILRFMPSSPSYTEVDIRGWHLPTYCATCFLLAEDTADGGHVVKLQLSGYEYRADVHLDSNWTITSAKLYGPSGKSQMEHSQDIVRNLFFHALNLHIHTFTHMIATTSATLAHHHISPGHQVHTFLTDYLHPWISIENDVFGFHLASLRNHSTILDMFLPNMRDAYLSANLLGLAGSETVDAKYLTALKSMLDLDRVSAGYAQTYPSAATYRKVLTVFKETSERFVNTLYEDEGSFQKDSGVYAWTKAMRDNLEPYAKALGMQNILSATDPLRREDLRRALDFFLMALLIHSENMANDLTSEICKWTLNADGPHQYFESYMIEFFTGLGQNPTPDFLVRNAKWPYKSTQDIMDSMQASLSGLGLTNMTFSCY